ncbi:MAG TPA: efflux RND transporter periplasmic adaptor subunit [Blastocatellia bacterium]|nr:efflux RND transporter periplasmic adaptor subunit [Blastocatellia bacterium]
MLKKLRLKHLLILLPVLALIGFTGYKVRQAMKAKAELQAGGAGGPGGAPGGAGGGRGGAGGGPGAGGGGRAQQVQTGVVSSGRITEKIALTGSLKAKESVDVNPKIAGRLLRITVDVGAPVGRGALLAVIEDDEIAQQIERAKASIAVVDASIAQREAELQNAKVELDRRRKLVEEGILSRTELDGLDTRYRVAQSQLELVRAQRKQNEAELRELNIRRGQTRVYSPISGVIARRHVDTGAMVSSGTPIVTVVSVSPMVILATASERDIPRIRRGAAVTVTIDSLPNQTLTGRVMRIVPLLDPSTRNGQVEIEIPNRGGVLKGEMFARVELNLGSERETLLLPRDALVYRGDQPGVYMIEKDTAKFLPVETGLTQEDKVEVISGLKLGDVVITRGSNLLKDGDRVRVQEARQGGGPEGGRGGGSAPEGAKPAASGQPPSGAPREQRGGQPPAAAPGQPAPSAEQKRGEPKQ